MIHFRGNNLSCLSFRWPVLLLLIFSSGLSSAQMPDGFIREQLATDLNPTSIVVSNDGRIFITEKHGLIRIVKDGQLLDDPFLTLEVDDSNERGLGHMVLHPQFEQNNYYYIFYAVPGMRHNRISRFTANGDNTVPESELVILDLDVLGNTIHNGGDMVFGFDGYLYVSTGEGGQNWKSEDLESTLGKILRIDEEGNAVPDNPWYDLNESSRNLVYAYGLRNPFTMTLNPVTGDFFANDVGGNDYEEVNKIERGAFYGWPTVEGMRTTEIVPNEYKDPVFTYAHTNNYCAIVGSAFYSPAVQQFPDKYVDRFFYADYCTGNIRMLDPITWQDKGAFISDGDRVVDIDITPEGSLLYLERRGLGDGSPEDNTGSNDGVLWKVTYTGSGAPFISVQPKSVLSAVGEDARFSVAASGAVPLVYDWVIDGIEQLEHNTPELTIFDVMLEQDSTTIEVRVSNDEGFQRSEEVLLRVTDNHRPEPMIISPALGSLYKGGDTILFSGQAVDIEDGALSEEAISWKIDFQHGTHSHPGLPWTSGISYGEWVVPSLGETSTDVWYRFYLKAIDSEGFSKVSYRDIYPAKGIIHVNAEPEGLVINLDGAAKATPYDINGVIDISRFITAPSKQVVGDSIFFFNRWNDGSTERNREVKTSATDQEIIGAFSGLRKGRGFGLTASYYDNIDFEGDPIAVAIDSILDNQYHLNAPYPGVPDENFGIIWNGYIQPYKSGWYEFTVFADDGIFVDLNNTVIIHNWEPGVHHEEGSIYLEGGHLYPVIIKLYDGGWASQIRLRWASSDFPEEIIPSAQLYPADYFAGATEPGVVIIETIGKDELLFAMVSIKEVELQMSIVSVNGNVINLPDASLAIGENVMQIDIRNLASGMYFLRTIDASDGSQTTLPFIKAQ